MFRNMTVGRKLALGFATVLILTAIIATFGVVQMRKVDGGVMDLVDVHIPLSEYVRELDSSATNQDLQVSLYVVHKEQSQLDDFEKLDQEVDQLLEKASETVNTDEELVAAGWPEKLEEIAEAHDAFVV